MKLYSLGGNIISSSESFSINGRDSKEFSLVDVENNNEFIVND
jgi:hypothetical protein